MDELPAGFGKYFLTEKIATGGMAEIYLAKLLGPSGFEKQLVIKQIHPELGGKRPFVDMLVAEAKTLVSLSHGNIVPVYELGVVDEVYFIAMEYIDGPTLGELTRAHVDRDAPMEPVWAAYIAAEILKGLDYAHRKGVIHRDLSPRNVMLSREGEVKLVDFGIALRADDDLHGERLAGSYPYMSPEQARGDALGPASDLFSAGVLLWEMLAGEPLFARPSPEDTLRAVAEAPVPPPSARRTGGTAVAAMLDEICLRALERNPASRYASAADFLAALHRYLYSLEVPVTPAALSALVARWCPPVVRQAGGEDGGEARGGDARSQEAQESGAATRPLPARVAQDSTQPLPERRRRRPSTMRTFATNVAFEKVLARATPLFPLAAISEEEAQTARTLGSAAARSTGDEQPGTTRPRLPRLRVATAAVSLIALLGAAMLTMGGSDESAGAGDRASKPVVAVELDKTAAPLRDAGGVRIAASADAVRSGHDVSAAGADAVRSGHDVSAAGADAARSGQDVSAAATSAGVRAADMAGIRPHEPAQRGAGRSSSKADTSAESRRSAASAPAAQVQPGRLKVGANPWAEVYLDGRVLGRAPNAWTVPPGQHTVEVVFPVAGREARQRFTVTVEPGAETSLGVIDFTDDTQ